VSSEIARGLDIFALTPSRHITQNEIDAANTVRFEQLNVQEQPKITWPPSFAKARAFVDQLERSGGLSPARVSALRAGLTSAESASGAARRTALTQLAGSVDATASSDRGKALMLVEALGELAGTGGR